MSHGTYKHSEDIPADRHADTKNTVRDCDLATLSTQQAFRDTQRAPYMYICMLSHARMGQQRHRHRNTHSLELNSSLEREGMSTYVSLKH